MRQRLAERQKSHDTVDEVAALTGRAPYTVRRWIQAGRLAAVRVPGTGPKGRLLVPREELARLVGSGRAGRVPDSAVE